MEKGMSDTHLDSFCMYEWLDLHRDQTRSLTHNFWLELVQSMGTDILLRKFYLLPVDIPMRYRDNPASKPTAVNHHSTPWSIDLRTADCLDQRRVVRFQDIPKHKFWLWGRHMNQLGMYWRKCLWYFRQKDPLGMWSHKDWLYRRQRYLQHLSSLFGMFGLCFLHNSLRGTFEGTCWCGHMFWRVHQGRPLRTLWSHHWRSKLQDK